jgi:hypothetical protein
LDNAQGRFQIFHPATHHFQEQGIEAAQSAKCPANGNSRINEKKDQQQKQDTGGQQNQDYPKQTNLLNQLVPTHFQRPPNHNPSIVSKRGFSTGKHKINHKNHAIGSKIPCPLYNKITRTNNAIHANTDHYINR